MFPVVKLLAKGYDRDQVEEFFDLAKQAYEGSGGPPDFDASDVREAAFDIVPRGYSFAAVDAALDRLEAAFVQRARADHIAVNGQEAWMSHVASQATTLYPRLLRPPGARFRHPVGRKRGYEVGAVDELLERLVAYFDEGVPLTSAQVRAVTFPSARGSRAYEEGTVDAYIARAVEVLLAVE
ncbi:MAG: DivIVA domain-containing protein [Actinomycetaceae bacterium]|nr:DivIVA domain-containing protein [Actinomycetaceae bacterium]